MIRGAERRENAGALQETGPALSKVGAAGSKVAEWL